MTIDQSSLNTLLQQGWDGNNQMINKGYRFADFRAAMAFMQAAIEGIEELNHHPEWSNVYNQVKVQLTTHDAGNVVTDKDIKLAQLLDQLAGAQSHA
ncbi:MAG: pterin-4-alpha-carbinolamine dehydratase [Planctomycetota bacterium]|nr:MAG: pterin-4-alpha-carbinolamine dehydratase [Planctomycetota bacterium]